MELVRHRPAWQRDECPAWCVVVHADDDHPHDHKHVSASRAVPVVALAGSTDGGGAGRDRDVADEMVVCLQRRDGGPDTWLYVGDGHDQRVEVTVESWLRLLLTVERMCTLAQAGSAQARPTSGGAGPGDGQR
ncbi:hypothetical protein AGMMS50218_13790 [Actinomycetota bacterium]|nr:hypothetical protein AGMMS50218_13790 [Actinomycetota bacterium]